jgi:transposase InsO family protein
MGVCGAAESTQVSGLRGPGGPTSALWPSGASWSGWAPVIRSPGPIGLKPTGRQNGFIQTLLREWAFARLYRTNEERQEALAKWVHYYNHHRSHTALGGRVPAALSVNNVCGNHS